MTNILSPSQAAIAASLVYDVQDANSSSGAIKLLNKQFNDAYNFNIGNKFTGKSGLPIISTRSGFGIMGISQDYYTKSCIITIRGTAKFSDWITDANCGLSFRNSRSNKAVHAGFNHAFNSMAPQINNFIDQHKPANVHCVGHSLGGALATLVAEWLAVEKNIASVNLYTFGSPRVGLTPFAKNLSSMKKINTIFRATNAGDPIPLVPVWPFTHTPNDGSDYRVLAGTSINPTRHMIKHYLDGVGSIDDWSQIKRVSNYTPDIHIEQFLNSPNGQGSLRSTGALEKIGDAILYLLRKTGLIISMSIQNSLGVGLTLYDAIAWKLSNLAGQSPDMKNQVTNLMSHIAAFIGLTLNKTRATTIETIRLLFNQMISLLYYMARSSIGRLF